MDVRTFERNWMTLRTLLVCFISAVLSACTNQSIAQVSARESDSNSAPLQSVNTVVDSLVKDSMADNYVPGLGLVVVLNGKIIHSKGYGITNVQNGTAVTARTPFGAGSLSKSVTAVAVMKLVEQGRIDLDTSVTEYLPYFKTNSSLTNMITVRHLLTMSSGLPTSADAWLNPPGDDALKEFVEDLKNCDLLFEPGAGYEYSNDSYVVLGHIVEAVTGVTYEQYMQENILYPIGMKSSTFNPGDLGAGAEFQGYVRGVSVPHLPRPFTFIRKYQPTGMLITNADELGRYIQFQLGDGRAAGGGRLLSRTSMEAMHHPAVAAESTLGDSTHYAFGWETKVREGLRVVEHGGEVETFVSYILLLPEEEIGIGMLVNMADYGKIQLIYNLARALTGRDTHPYRSSPTNRPEQPKAVAVEDGTYLQYTGSYKSRHGVLEVRAVENGLKAIRGANTAYREEAILYPIAQNKFFSVAEAVRADSLTYHFKNTPEGMQVFVDGNLYATVISAAAKVQE